MSNQSKFDADYFERGKETGKSCYSHYRWLPELTTNLARTYIKHLKIQKTDRILDYGCAKGYTVKALRALGYHAWGCDISEYALGCADPETVPYLKLSTKLDPAPFWTLFDFIIAKDVFEHIPESEIDPVLQSMRCCGKNLFAIIPLGDHNEFVVPEYELDITHCTRQNPLWWIDKLKSNSWKLKEFSYLVPGMKDNWAHYPKGNGFFLAINRI